MTVESTSRRAQYSTNGTTGPFTVPFYFLADGDLAVTYTDDDGIEATLTLTTDYSVSGAADPAGGSITTVTAYASGGLITILRNVDPLQEVDYVEGDPFPAETHETALDRLTMVDQQTIENVSRAIQFPPSDTGGASATLPTAANRLDLMPVFNALTGDVEVSSFTATEVASAVAAAYDAGASTADAVVFVQSGTGAVTRSAQDKMRDEVHAKDFGAVGSGDETAELKACFDYAIPLGRTVVLTGAYTISGPITASRSDVSIAAGSLHIRCDGDVTITVDAGSTGFTTVIGCYTTAANNASVKGGHLTIDCASKAANGLFIRHLAASWSGVISIDNVKAINCKNTDASSAAENSGITVYGRYETVHLDHPIVYNVSRTNTAAGVCCGITVSDFQGQCTIDSPYVANVLCTGATADADGIRVFGYATGTTYQARAGYAQINDPVCVDCQGRSIKVQAQEVEIYRPRCYRQLVVSIATVDIDMQTGGAGKIIEPMFEYRKNGGTSPLDASFYPIALQLNGSARPNSYAVRGGELRSEVAMVRYAAVIVSNAASLGGECTVEGLECQSFGALAGSAIFSRAVVEVDTSQTEAAAGTTRIVLRGNKGNFSGCGALGYTGAPGVTLSKTQFEIVGNQNTGADSANSKAWYNLSGTVVTSVGTQFKIADNAGFNDLLGTWNFDAKLLWNGCKFAYTRATSTVTNGPAIAAGTYCAVEALGQLVDGVRNVRITVDNANAANTVYYTSDCATWGVIK